MTLPRWIKITLVTSIGLNLLIGVAVVSFVASGHHDAPHISPPRDSANTRGDVMGVLLRELDRDQRRELGRSIRTTLQENHASAQDMRALSAALADEIAKETPDAAAINAILTQFRTVADLRQQAVHTHLINALIDLPHDTRTRLAEKMRRGRGQR